MRKPLFISLFITRSWKDLEWNLIYICVFILSFHFSLTCMTSCGVKHFFIKWNNFPIDWLYSPLLLSIIFSLLFALPNRFVWSKWCILISCTWYATFEASNEIFSVILLEINTIIIVERILQTLIRSLSKTETRCSSFLKILVEVIETVRMHSNNVDSRYVHLFIYVCIFLSFLFFLFCLCYVFLFSLALTTIKILIYSLVLFFFLLIAELERNCKKLFSLLGFYIISSRTRHPSYPSSCLCFSLYLSFVFVGVWLLCKSVPFSTKQTVRFSRN
jgi:hypothetical protein